MLKINFKYYGILQKVGVVVGKFRKIWGEKASSAGTPIFFCTVFGISATSKLLSHILLLIVIKRSPVKGLRPVTKCDKCFKRAGFVTFCHKLLQRCKFICHTLSQVNLLILNKISL